MPSRDRKELGFFDHLDELRIRIIRSVLYIVVGGAADGRSGPHSSPGCVTRRRRGRDAPASPSCPSASSSPRRA